MSPFGIVSAMIRAFRSYCNAWVCHSRDPFGPCYPPGMERSTQKPWWAFWRRAHRVSQTQGPLASHLCPMTIIVGSPRSGTTLLRLMLDSHPELTIPPETGFLTLAPKLSGKGDKLREKFLRAVTT